MASKSQYCEIEIVAPKSRSVYFKPIGRRLRGRVDLSNARSDRDKAVREHWPQVVPGERICFDFVKQERYTAEPLHRDEYEELRATVIRREFSLRKKRDDAGSGESVATWVYHCHRLIQSGLARVVEGELPEWESFDEPPRKRFITQEVVSESAKLADVLSQMAAATEANTAMLAALADRIAGKQTTAKS